MRSDLNNPFSGSKETATHQRSNTSHITMHNRQVSALTSQAGQATLLDLRLSTR